MASIRTEITELATALGMLGYDTPERALAHCPREFVDVDEHTWGRFAEASDRPEHRIDFHGAFRNGEVFAEADHGLRGRRPQLIEWKGGHRLPGQDQLPVDLRVDHVFLVSCKYASKILLNAAMENKKLTARQRESTLARMEKEVAHLVLNNNYIQTQILSIEASFGESLQTQQSRAITLLEEKGLLNRELEHLADDNTLQERFESGRYLTRPELAVLLSYSKMDLYQALLDSALARPGQKYAYDSKTSIFELRTPIFKLQ